MNRAALDLCSTMPLDDRVPVPHRRYHTAYAEWQYPLLVPAVWPFPFLLAEGGLLPAGGSSTDAGDHSVRDANTSTTGDEVQHFPRNMWWSLLGPWFPPSINSSLSGGVERPEE